jgi:broad specificity phosphatase PhoE
MDTERPQMSEQHKTRIYMIRHGKAAAGWDGDADPGLDDLGRQQSAAVAEKLKQLISAPVPILSSPLKRCQETAIPLAESWQASVHIEPRVAEIPSPIEDLTARTVWLRRVMGGTWQALYDDPESTGHDFAAWYNDVIEALTDLHQTGAREVVVYSHFIALNVAYCAATGDDKVMSFAPDNCSLSIFETDGQTLSLVRKGDEAQTLVN